MTWSWYVFILVPVVWLLQNCLHESAHAFVAKHFQKAMIVKFWPFPTIISGTLYFGHVVFAMSETMKAKYFKLNSISPLIMACIWGVVSAVVLILVPVEARIFIVPFVAAPVVDALWWWRGYFWGSWSTDGKKFRKGHP